MLCDKGALQQPLVTPLAVDPQGNYLTRKDLIKYSGQDLPLSQTTVQLRASVIAMLGVALFANSLSVLWLTGYLGNMLVVLRWVCLGFPYEHIDEL